jgi:hypothetical protein
VGGAIKQRARSVIDALPEMATWSEVLYAIELCADVEAGTANADAGAVTGVHELRR